MLAIILSGQGIAALDTSIVNVAIPSVRHGLGASAASVQVVVSAYLLTYAVLLITGARLGRDHGHSRLFRLGLLVFTATSLVCGLSPTIGLLIAARAAQGAGAALMVPQVLSLVQLRFSGPARATAVGLYSFVLGAGVACGQLAGGALVTADIAGSGWRPVFLVNVPLGAALLAASRRLPPDEQGPRALLDLRGVALLTAAMTLVLVPLTFGQEQGWPAWTAPAALAAAVVWALFLSHEGALARRGGMPLVDPRMLTTAGVGAGLAVVFILYVGYGGLLFVTAVHLQSGLHFSAMRSGLAFASYAAGFGLVNTAWSHLPARFQRWVPTVGLAVLIAGNCWLAWAAHAGSWGPAAAAALFVAGTGHGAGFGAGTALIAACVRPEHRTALGGAIPTTIQLAIAVGVAGIGAIYLASGPAGSLSAASSGHAYALAAGSLAALDVIGLALAVRMAARHGVHEAG